MDQGENATRGELACGFRFLVPGFLWGFEPGEFWKFDFIPDLDIGILKEGAVFDTKFSDLMLLYGISPLHAGSGQGLGVVDNPIQRERHTDWPFVQASGVKGAFRDHFERSLWMKRFRGIDPGDARGQVLALSRKIFGKSLEDGADVEQAGAVAVSDARMLLFPVRSSVAPFVWVVCPSVLNRFRRDAFLAGVSVPEVPASPAEEEGAVLRNESGARIEGDLLLEDLAVTVSSGEGGSWKDWLAKNLPDCRKVLCVSDFVFTTLVRTATEIQAQIAIRFDTGTTKDGSLRYQELLPADSVLYVLTFFTGERIDGGNGLPPEAVMQHFREFLTGHVQIGGDWSLGRGICRIHRMNGEGGRS